MSAYSDLQWAIKTGDAKLIADAQIAFDAECQKEAWDDAHMYDTYDNDEDDEEGDD